MSFYGSEVIGRIENRLTEPPGFYSAPDTCGLCGLVLEDCEKGLGCIRCSVCGEAGCCRWVDCGNDEAVDAGYFEDEREGKAVAKEEREKAVDQAAERAIAEAKEA